MKPFGAYGIFQIWIYIFFLLHWLVFALINSIESTINTLKLLLLLASSRLNLNIYNVLSSSFRFVRVYFIEFYCLISARCGFVFVFSQIWFASRSQYICNHPGIGARQHSHLILAKKIEIMKLYVLPAIFRLTEYYQYCVMLDFELLVQQSERSSIQLAWKNRVP